MGNDELPHPTGPGPAKDAGLGDAELAAQRGEALPAREQLSLVAPGATTATPAVLPVDAFGVHPAPPGSAVPL